MYLFIYLFIYFNSPFGCTSNLAGNAVGCIYGATAYYLFLFIHLFFVLFCFSPFLPLPVVGSAQRKHGAARSRTGKGGADQEDADPAGAKPSFTANECYVLYIVYIVVSNLFSAQKKKGTSF